MTQSEKSARIILKNCLNIKAHESLLIVAEESLSEIGEELWKAARKISPFAIFMKFSYKYVSDYGLPAPIYQSLNHAESVIFITPKSVNDTLFDKARQNGTRIILLKNISKRLFDRIWLTDCKKLANQTRKIADIFSIGKNMHLLSSTGTDAEIKINRIKGDAETGVAIHAGEFTCLPAGKAHIFLNEKNINGILALDMLAGQKIINSKPVVLKIENGHIKQTKGEKEAEFFRKKIRKLGKSGRKISELSIGTNDKISVGHSTQEDEISSGAVNITIGQNRCSNINSKFIPAIKGIILKPTVCIDGKTIVEEGNILNS